MFQAAEGQPPAPGPGGEAAGVGGADLEAALERSLRSLHGRGANEQKSTTTDEPMEGTQRNRREQELPNPWKGRGRAAHGSCPTHSTKAVERELAAAKAAAAGEA
eukprot:gene4165-17431_t